LQIDYNTNKLERFIPITFVELEENILFLNIANKEDTKKFATLLRKIYHTIFHTQLLDIKKDYHSFNPDRDTITLKQYNNSELKNIEDSFLKNMIPLLNSANYEQLSQEEINEAFEETSPYGVEVSVDFNEFDNILLFFRGSAIKQEKRRTLKKLFLKKEDISTQIYRRLFILFKQKVDGKDLIYLKLFKDIPKSDLEMLFPNTKVKIALLDKVKLAVTGGGGTIAGSFTLLGKLAIALEPMALLSAIGAFGAIVWRQISSIFNHRVKYMAQLTKNLYFYNLDNNAGAISYILDMAEDEESKEVFLSYMFLLQSKEPLSIEDLDLKIEQYIQEQYSVPMDFEIDDAIQKLVALNLVIKLENKYQAKSIQKSIEILTQY